MSLYPQLLLNRGGGIVSDTSKADQSAGGATIAIGLGGTGIDCLKNFKKEVYNRIKADNHDSKEASIPEYNHIRFLAIDTAADSIKSDKDDVSDDYAAIDRSEFIKISVDDIKAALGAHGHLNKNPDMKWLAHEPDSESGKEAIKITDMKDGAGGIRQAGRFAIIDRANDIMNAIRTLISSATENHHDKLSIHIFAGIGGGTGSGSFLDICYIVKMILEQMALPGSTTVCGYFFLPDVNLSKSEILNDKLLTEQIERNGYAALKELDYCMNFESNGDHWEQSYDGNRYTTTMPPVDMCHLISSKTVDGGHSSNSYQYAINVVTDYVLEFTADQGGSFGMDQHRANVSGQVSQIRGEKGALYKYSVLGASSAAVPYREINTYLATNLFAQFGSIYDVEPSEQAVKKVADDVGLNFNSLFREYIKGANIDGYMGIAKTLPIKQLKADMNPLIQAFNNYDDKILGQQDENGKQLQQELNESFDPRQSASNSTSVISRIFNNLYVNVICNPANGPFYARNILNGLNNKSLLNIIDGIVTTNNEKYSHYHRVAGECEEKMDMAKVAYLNKQNTRNTNNYVEAMVNFYTNRGYSYAYNRFGVVLSNIKRQISELSAKYFDILCRVLKNLKDTFSENESALNTMMAKSINDDDYVRPIMTIAELKQAMDETLRTTKIDEVLKKIITTMADNPNIWIHEDSFRISKFINDIMSNDIFAKFANQSILAFLQMKFNETDSQKIEKKLEESVISTLEKFSKALFWKDPTYKIENTSKLEYVSVPANSSILVNAANNFKNAAVGSNMSVRQGKLSDRISFMKFYCGVPMYSYKGLEEYERIYSDNPKSGTHLYERGESPDKHWEEYLPSPIPVSFDRVSDNMKSDKYNKEALDVYEKGKEKGIIKIEDNNLIIRSYDYSELITEYKKAEELASKGRNADAEKVYNEAHSKLENKKLPVLVSSVIIGSSFGEHIVIDKFVMYPKYRDKVVEELAKLEEIEKRDVEASKPFKGSEDYTIFKDAYFVGLIVFKPLFSVKLDLEDEYGFSEEIVLCDTSSEYKTVPVYQAYLNFCQLDADVKEAVQKKVEEYLSFEDENKTQQVIDNTQTVANKFNPDYIKMLQENCKICNDPVGSTSFIKKFVMDFTAFNKMIKTSF